MDPILLIHGYSSEGKDNKVEDIYGSLPADLRREFGAENVKDINLSRWISLSDGVALDDVSFAMDRALKEKFPELLEKGFHVIIHSTGALVVRNWIRKFSAKPSPINNLVHLAGANFGSGLAHIGQGQLSRWGRFIMGTGRGTRILDELEFGSWKTLDLHISYLEKDNDMYDDFQVQEFCMNGSQTLGILRPVPIRYVKEDSADNTVRTSACNLNFNYIPVTPKEKAYNVHVEQLAALIEDRLNNKRLEDSWYEFDLSGLCKNRTEIPFSVIYETAHYGEDIGIVSGKDNRPDVMSLLKRALETPYDRAAYGEAAQVFREANKSTFDRAAKLKSTLLEWNKQEQYEGHAQLVFRLKDQFGNAVEHFDITLKSDTSDGKKNRLERMIEDKHVNKKDNGSIVFYLRTQKFDNETWYELLPNVAPLDVEITGYEPLSGNISYLPLTIQLSGEQVKEILQSFRTTIIDITLVRLPSDHVFEITKV